MATRIEDILIRCRDSLADEDKSRWSDARLLRLIDEAQKKIASKAQLLRKTVTMSILANINEYQLPSDAFLLTRVISSTGAKYEIKSHSNMDDLGDSKHTGRPIRGLYTSSYIHGDVGIDWEYDTGSEVEYIIFDNQQPGQFKVYPIPTEAGVSEVFVIDTYGVVSAIEDDALTSSYGVVADISVNALDFASFNSVYGITVDMASVTEVIKIYYRAKAATVDAVTDLLEIDDKWDAAIKHYVVGMALHDDQDTQNRQVSADEIGLYGVEFGEAKAISSKDNASRSNSRTTYNSEI